MQISEVMTMTSDNNYRERVGVFVRKGKPTTYILQIVTWFQLELKVGSVLAVADGPNCAISAFQLLVNVSDDFLKCFYRSLYCCLVLFAEWVLACIIIKPWLWSITGRGCRSCTNENVKFLLSPWAVFCFVSWVWHWHEISNPCMQPHRNSLQWITHIYYVFSKNKSYVHCITRTMILNVKC